MGGDGGKGYGIMHWVAFRLWLNSRKNDDELRTARVQ